jgi:hypothetical protein
MGKILTRYDIQVNSDNEQMNIDLILNSNDKKVIHGTVWDDNISSPKRVPEALVQLYLAGENYRDDPLDIKLVGFVFSDASGEFLAGPFDSGTTVIIKVFKFWKYDIYNESNNSKVASKTNVICSTSTSGEVLGPISGEYSGEIGY